MPHIFPDIEHSKSTFRSIQEHGKVEVHVQGFEKGSSLATMTRHSEMQPEDALLKDLVSRCGDERGPKGKPGI